MSRWWSTAPIRVRLTIWYTAAMTLLLVLYAGVTFIAVRHEFREGRNDEGEVLLVLVLGLPVVVAVAGLGGYVLARRTLGPIDRIAIEARRISAEHLHERLSISNQHDEIGRLAAVVNETLADLETSFEQLRRFTADASHELRTPLAAMRGIGELSLGKDGTTQDYKEAVESMLEEVERLSKLVDTLLRLSRGDAGTIRLEPEPVDLAEIARQVVASLGILAEERHQRLRVTGEDGVYVSADRLVLRDALTNVVDNAIRYGPENAGIEVRVKYDAEHATIIVIDEGPGIPVEHRSRVFDRFYRVDDARSREAGGTGLGLAIAKWAVEANGGRIALDDSEWGSVFRIILPRRR